MKYRQLIALIEANGWRSVRQAGSHIQFRHAVKQGTVTVPGGGKLNRDAPPGIVNSVKRQAGFK